MGKNHSTLHRCCKLPDHLLEWLARVERSTKVPLEGATKNLPNNELFTIQVVTSALKGSFFAFNLQPFPRKCLYEGRGLLGLLRLSGAAQSTPAKGWALHPSHV